MSVRPGRSACFVGQWWALPLSLKAHRRHENSGKSSKERFEILPIGGEGAGLQGAMKEAGWKVALIVFLFFLGKGLLWLTIPYLVARHLATEAQQILQALVYS